MGPILNTCTNLYTQARRQDFPGGGSYSQGKWTLSLKGGSHMGHMWTFVLDPIYGAFGVRGGGRRTTQTPPPPATGLVYTTGHSCSVFSVLVLTGLNPLAL